MNRLSVEGGQPVLTGPLSPALALGSRKEPTVWPESGRTTGTSSWGASSE